MLVLERELLLNRTSIPGSTLNASRRDASPSRTCLPCLSPVAPVPACSRSFFDPRCRPVDNFLIAELDVAGDEILPIESNRARRRVQRISRRDITANTSVCGIYRVTRCLCGEFSILEFLTLLRTCVVTDRRTAPKDVCNNVSVYDVYEAFRATALIVMLRVVMHRGS